MSRETHPYVLIDPVCGQPAIFRVAPACPTDHIRAADHEHIDGRPVLGSEVFACDSCGRALWRDAVTGVLLQPEVWRRR
jgi:hypothetical protein